jgi:tripartite-type tricarboxylate transporter receptor subunit TctC
MKLPRRAFLHLAAALGALPAVSQSAKAQTYPSRPIRLTASDIIGRVFAKGAGPVLGQEVVVENKPGAGSSIAAEYVARADKDGYTLFVPALSTLTDEIVAGRSVDMSRDFAAITLLGNLAIVLVVNPQANVHSVTDLITVAKSKPGKVLYASVGAGTLPHLCTVMFAQRAGLDLVGQRGAPSELPWCSRSLTD